MAPLRCTASALAAAALATAAGALDNGLARTPPMGWMTWCEPKHNALCPAASSPIANTDPDRGHRET